MTPQQLQLQLLKTNLIAAGLLPANATDDQAVSAANQLHQNDPDTLQKMLGSSPSWMTILGLGAGALAIYLVWSHYLKARRLGEVSYPDPVDTRHQLRGFSKSLGKFAGRSGCRSRSLGGAEYEFEPEVRLEGHRGAKRHIRRAR